MIGFDDVIKILDTKRVKYEVVVFTDVSISARTTDTSKNHNYDPANSIKTLIISTKDDYKAVIARGRDKIDQPKLKAIVGKWRVVDAGTLQNKLGYVPGTINPLVLGIPVLIDTDASEMKLWSMGAGANDRGVNVEVKEAFKHLDKLQIISIKQ